MQSASRLVLTGAIGVLAASICYGIVPPPASLPLAIGTDPEATRAVAETSRGLLQLAGTIGLIADVPLMIGAVLMARSGHPLFWLATALSTGVFFLFDGLMSQALGPALATSELFAPLRVVLSLAFVTGIGVFAFGAFDLPVTNRNLRRGGQIYGGLGVAAALLWFVVPVPALVFGALIFVAVATLIAIAIRDLRNPQIGLSQRAFT